MIDHARRWLLVVVALAAPLLQVPRAATADPQMLTDIFAGASSSLPLSNAQVTFHPFAAVGGTLFFYATDATNGNELWRSDGTEAGTVLVKDILPGSGSSFPRSLVAVGGTLFFTADDGISGRELWRSDGTEAGTFRVKDILAGAGTSAPEELVNVGGTLFFGAYDGSASGLWRSDGTQAGTVRVKAVGSPRQLVAIGGTLFFVGSDITNGRELWRSDGTEVGTVLVKDIMPGSNSPPALDSFAAAGGVLLFRAWGPDGIGLWRSDGTDAGTRMVKRVFPAPPHGGVACETAPLATLAAVGETVFFSAEDETASGQELWRSDGTEEGTFQVKDINLGPGSSNPQCLVVVGGTLYFSATDGTNGFELWRSDGTDAGTLMVSDSFPGLNGSGPHFLTDAGGTLFFSATDSQGTELWRSDGTEAGTFMAADIAPFSSAPQSLIYVDGHLFFSADDGINGREPWVFALKPPATGCGDGIVWGAPAPIVYGTALGGEQLNATAGVPGTFAYTPAEGAVLDAGTHSLSVTFTPDDSTNCDSVSASVALSVLPASLTIAANDATMILNGPLPALTASYSGLVNGDTPSSLDSPAVLATAADGSAVGTFPISVSGASDPNYSVTLRDGALTVLYSSAACLGERSHSVLEPVDANGTSVFRQGSTIPIKFRVCDANGVPIGAADVVQDFRLVEILDGTASTVTDDPVGSTTPDTTFRWAGDHWIFNLATRPLAVGRTYVYRITLDDGTMIEFRFGLR